MIIRCPQCTTRYQVDPATIGPDGRTVRCTRCGHSWLQAPEPQPATVVAPEPADPAPRAPADAPAPDAAPTPAAAAEPQPVAAAATERRLSAAGHRPVRSRPAREHRAPSGGRAAGVLWALLVVVVLGTAAAAVFWRDAIVRIWPAAAPFYQLVGLGAEPPGTGFGLEKVAWKALNRDGARVLAVEGEIANQSDIARQVPPIYGVLYDKDDRELQRWRIAPTETRLLPGERVPFQSEMKEPAAAAVRLQITFTPKSGAKP